MNQDFNCVNDFTSLMHDINKNSQFELNYGLVTMSQNIMKKNLSIGFIASTTCCTFINKKKTNMLKWLHNP